jgi:hypothetical protein
MLNITIKNSECIKSYLQSINKNNKKDIKILILQIENKIDRDLFLELCQKINKYYKITTICLRCVTNNAIEEVNSYFDGFIYFTHLTEFIATYFMDIQKGHTKAFLENINKLQTLKILCLSYRSLSVLKGVSDLSGTDFVKWFMTTSLSKVEIQYQSNGYTYPECISGLDAFYLEKFNNFIDQCSKEPSVVLQIYKENSIPALKTMVMEKNINHSSDKIETQCVLC